MKEGLSLAALTAALTPPSWTRRSGNAALSGDVCLLQTALPSG